MIRNVLQLLRVFRMRGRRPQRKRIAVPPLKSDQVNVFAGTFASEAAATDYAMGLGDGPALSQDLGGVGIGPDDVEIIFGPERMAAARPMLHFKIPAPMSTEANVYILLSDRAYPTDLPPDAPVHFLGLCEVS